jgi:uncharacterized protein (DUF433 family)
MTVRERHPAQRDVRYTLAEAAHLVGTSSQNVRRWLSGYEASGHRMKPVFQPREKKARPLVSFVELCELRVVAAFRCADRRVSLDRLRQAHGYARENLRLEHPFASDRLRLEGGHVLYEFSRAEPGPGTLVLDEGGQVMLPWAVLEALGQFDYDSDDHMIRRWFPFGHDIPIVVDPERGSGMPTISGRNLRSDFLVGRWKRGESISPLAEDFELEPAVVESALRAAA